MHHKLVVFSLTLLFALAFLMGGTGGLAVGQAAAEQPLSAVSSSFTYQGHLTNGGSPATGTYDFHFTLHDAPSGGSQVAGPVNVENVPVREGRFTVQLDFGSDAFSGAARYLQVGVRPGSDTGSYTLLSPRQPLTASPYALFAQGTSWQGLRDVPPSFADGVDHNTTYSAGAGLALSGTGDNLTLALNTGYTDNRYWRLGGNSGTSPDSHFLGTTDSVSLTLAVSGTQALRLEPTSGTPNLIGGYSGNSVTPGVVGATIAGGGAPDGGGGSPAPNRVTDHYGVIAGGWGNRAGDDDPLTSNTQATTVSGGYRNTASGDYATVGGGFDNTASGYAATVSGGYTNTASNMYATVGGGISNTASYRYATVGGGQRNSASEQGATVSGGYVNTASGYVATVSGGQINSASGFAATVGGGYRNTASGAFSFAAGRRARANNPGCFVWADAADSDVSCNTNNRTIFRSRGGFYIYTNSTLSAGAYLGAGAGAWSSLSDRHAKENVVAVDPQTVLEGVVSLPISTWNYKSQDESVRHVGPMAQDFYATFDLGESDTHISTVDTDGVALAAIQGLYQRNQVLQAENADLRAHVDELDTRLRALEAGNAPSTPPLQSSLLPGVGAVLLGAVLFWRGRRKEHGR